MQTPTVTSASRRKALETEDVTDIAVNPHNFPHDITARQGEEKDERVAAARSLFDSTLAAQKNRVREFKVAKLIHSSPLAKTYLLAFGTGIAKALRDCSSSEEFEQKKNTMFKFYRDHQAGGVGVNDNLFLQQSGPGSPTHSDIALRELGASLAQTVAIGENKEFLRMLRKIADTPALKEKLNRHVDIDFFLRLCDECGCDAEGLPKTDAYRLKLYNQNGDLAVRTLAPDNCRIKAYRLSDLALSPRERRFIADTQQSVKRATGGQLWRIAPASSFARNAIADARPATSGPSGSMFHVVLAAKLMAPLLRSKLGLSGDRAEGPSGWTRYSGKLLMTTLMGYLHGEQEADHHHSLQEVLQGGQHADKLIRACYGKQTDLPGVEAFGYENDKTEFWIAQILLSASNAYPV